MKRYLRLQTLALALALATFSCGSKGRSAQSEPKNAVQKAVKDAVTQDFKAYEGAKDSIKKSEEKSQSDLEAIDKEMKE